MPYHIVLDTNVLQEDFLMRSGRFKILFDYVERTRSGFLLPEIVLEELAANYEKEIRSRVAKLSRKENQLNGVILQPLSKRVDIDIPKTVNDYVAFVKERLELTPRAVLPYSEASMRDAIKRAIQRRRPCSDHGEEIRDAILWNTLLEAGADKSKNLIFISKNTNDFSAADKMTLHPDLLKDLTDHHINIAYFPSLEEFAKKQATRIEFITKEWLEKEINPDILLDQAEDAVTDTARNIAKRQAGLDFEGFGSFRVCRGGLEVDEFFVYEMISGEFRIEITWYGHVEVEYEAETGERDVEWRYEYNALEDDFDYEPDYGSRKRHIKEKTIDLTVTVVTDVVVKDGKVTDWDIVDQSADG